MNKIVNSIEDKFGTIAAAFFVYVALIAATLMVVLWAYVSAKYIWPAPIPFIAAAWLAYSSHK